MKLLHLLTLLAATALAAPFSNQHPFTEKHDHAVKNPYEQRINFKTPFVVKASTTPKKAGSAKAPPRPIHTAVKLPAKAPKKTSWLDRWRTGGGDGSKMRAQACFCAGGSVCCSIAQRMDCYGVCGI